LAAAHARGERTAPLTVTPLSGRRIRAFGYRAPRKERRVLLLTDEKAASASHIKRYRKFAPEHWRQLERLVLAGRRWTLRPGDGRCVLWSEDAPRWVAVLEQLRGMELSLVTAFQASRRYIEKLQKQR